LPNFVIPSEKMIVTLL